jgi:hypothetical protein
VPCGKWAEDSHLLSLPHARKVDPEYEAYHQAAQNMPEMIGIYDMDPSPPPGIAPLDAPLTRADMQAAIQAAMLTLRAEMHAGIRREIAIREAERFQAKLTARALDSRMRAAAAAAGLVGDESPASATPSALSAAPEALVEENDEYIEQYAAAAEAAAAVWSGETAAAAPGLVAASQLNLINVIMQ